MLGREAHRSSFFREADFQVHYIGLSQLIVNKEATAREKDLDDLRFLRQRVKRT